MVIKKGEFEAARDIFERMIVLNLQPKRMKAFFKKYMEFEQTHGEPHRADQVGKLFSLHQPILNHSFFTLKVRKKALSYIETKFGNVDIDPEEELELD